MRSISIITALLFALSIQSTLAASKKNIITLSLKDYKKEMTSLQKQGFDVAGIDFPKKQVDLIVDDKEMAKIKSQGFKISELKIHDVNAKLDDKYQTPAKVEARLKELNTKFPALTELQSIGKSLLGRDIWALKITNSKTTFPTKKPVLLINAMHHAREVMTPEIPLDMAQFLLEGYGKDPKATQWVDTKEIWLIPMLNVDGNNIVWTSDTWWRKNARDSYGVDINRNYPYMWAGCDGSSDYRGAQDYHGPSAASEPETQVMMNIVSRIQPVFDISFHSYSEMVIYPYGCENSHTPTSEVVEGIGRQMASLLPSDSGSGTYTHGIAPDLLYSVDGSDIDWMYHDAQVIPYVIEVNGRSLGFQPSYDQWRDKTVMKLRAAWSLLLNRLDGSGLRGMMLNENKAPLANSSVKVERQGDSAFTQIYKVNNDGTFHLILNPGTYNVTYSASGYNAQSNTIVIGEQRTDVVVQLSK